MTPKSVILGVAKQRAGIDNSLMLSSLSGDNSHVLDGIRVGRYPRSGRIDDQVVSRDGFPLFAGMTVSSVIAQKYELRVWGHTG
jgi:hypothetical protein